MAGFASAATYWKHATLHALRASRLHDGAGNSGAPTVSSLSAAWALPAASASTCPAEYPGSMSVAMLTLVHPRG